MIDTNAGGPYLFHNLELPTLHNKAEKIFNHHPNQNQAKYVETNEEVDADETVLKTFSGGCHTADVASGEYVKVVNGVKAAMENRARK